MAKLAELEGKMDKLAEVTRVSSGKEGFCQEIFGSLLTTVPPGDKHF